MEGIFNSYRGRKPSGSITLPANNVESAPPPSSRPSPQPVHMIKQEPVVQPQQQQQQQQTMAQMPSFYADPNRFSTPVWQTADPTQGWTQGQFIQQIQTGTPQPVLETYPQQYANGVYQTTYQQQPAFESNPFYTGASVQVLSRPPSASNQTRSNGNYSHSPSPVSAQQQPSVNQRTNNISNQYQPEYSSGNQNYVAPSTPESRPGSVNGSQNFQPGSTGGFAPNANSGNVMPGYPLVSNHPQVASHNYSSGYPGSEMSGPESPRVDDNHHHHQHWTDDWDHPVKTENQDWTEQNGDNICDTKVKLEPLEYDDGLDRAVEPEFSKADRVNLNSRIKTMILTKQQQQQLENKEDKQQNTAGHFLLYSHHRHPYNLDDGGGVRNTNRIPQTIQKLKPRTLKQQQQVKSTIVQEPNTKPNLPKFPQTTGNVGAEIPPCNCLPPHEFTAEPGSYYTHLGCSSSLVNLRQDLEERTGVNGNALRIEKLCYTGKEGKTPQGCPIAKWIIRRGSYAEKYLILVKKRVGHFCGGAIIVVCIVAWEGVLENDANSIYNMLCTKLNKFGLPTNRRCATNEQRTCACQGLDPDTCGASFSFGCSWSMYYNGCKYARSKFVRKFRLNIKEEEEEVEGRLQVLATHLSPLYKTLAPVSFNNQCQFEQVAGDCRLGTTEGRPFSGVTACVDFCAHAHKDIHNMNNGCTVVVTLTKHRGIEKPKDEQLHVLPLYVIDRTDEFGSQENQEYKIIQGGIEVLYRYPFEVRVRNVPQPTCRRRKKKDDSQEKRTRKLGSPSVTPPVRHPQHKTPTNQLQSNQVSSTVTDNSASYDQLYYNPEPNYNYYNANLAYPSPPSSNNSFNSPAFGAYETSYENDYYNQPMTPPKTPASFRSNEVLVQNPFDDSFYFNQPDFYDYYAAQPVWNASPKTPPNNATKIIGQVSEVIENDECFKDPDVGGVAIALGHGSVLFECAKHELHATTALRAPNRLSPTRISLVFYQHRNLNRAMHGWNEHEEKMRLKKLEAGAEVDAGNETTSKPVKIVQAEDVMVKALTTGTVTMTTVFPMYPCITTGPYQIIGKAT